MGVGVRGERLKPRESSACVWALYEHCRRSEFERPLPRADRKCGRDRALQRGAHRRGLAIVAPRGEPQARLLRWGLIPPWAKDVKGAYKMINARIETVTSTPAYRELIPRGSRRALQIADGYFEWLKPERRGEPRQPFFFQVDGGVPFAFAAIRLRRRSTAPGSRASRC